MNYCQNDADEDDDMCLADMMSLKITGSPTGDKKMEWNDWSHQNGFYHHQQFQSSYSQLQYLQQQQMIMMTRNSSSSRRSSSASSTSSSNASRYRPSVQSYQLSPSTSNSSLQQHHRPEPGNKRTAVTPLNTSRTNRMSTAAIPNSIELPKRRQSLGKRIKKVFGMSEHGSGTTLDKKASELPKSIDVYASSSAKNKVRSSFSTSFMVDNTRLSSASPAAHNRRGSAPFVDTDIQQLPLPASSNLSTITLSSNTNSSTTSSKKSLSFNPVIKLHETFSAQEYDRRCDTSTTCQKLTPVLALNIKEELNNFKLNDMFVHMDSRKNTHFFM